MPADPHLAPRASSGGTRVLVTGATGFVGRHILAPLLSAGCIVGATARALPEKPGPKPDPEPDPRIAWFARDLLTEGAVRDLIAAFRPDVLVHAAWYAKHGLFWHAPENEAWLAATLALANAFCEAGGRRFVGIGSCAEYDWTGDAGAPLSEADPLAPATPYGRAKVEAARQVGDLCAGTATAFAWARLFHLFGPGEHPDRLVPAVARALLRGEEAAVGSGRQVRDFCDTGYAGRAIAAVALAEITGAINIGSGEATTIADLVQQIGELCGRPELIRLGTRADRPDDPLWLVPDLKRLRTEVGFTEPHGLRERLRSTIVFWRETSGRAEARTGC